MIPLLHKTKELYLSWYGCYKTLPKEHRYTLGAKIDNLLAEIIEAIASAAWLSKEEKLPHIKTAIRKTDAVKIFLLILWETKSLDNNKYLTLSEPINEIGCMLGGWHGQLIKQKLPYQK
jgi:hypothetical protein